MIVRLAMNRSDGSCSRKNERHGALEASKKLLRTTLVKTRDPCKEVPCYGAGSRPLRSLPEKARALGQRALSSPDGRDDVGVKLKIHRY